MTAITAPPAPQPPEPLALTGERTVPGIWHETYWHARHVAGYAAVGPLCAGRRVLEAGCGEGYGTALAVSAGARTVLGLDYDPAAIRHAAARYRGAGFALANLVQLPVASGAVDLVLSLQVLEHVWSPHELLRESRRVLAPGGLLALTTPNRITFSPGLHRGQRPTNPFHVREFDAAELRALVSEHLEPVRVAGVHAGPFLRALDERFGSLVDAQLAREPHQWDADLAEAVRSVRPEHFVVRDDDLDAALDLLVVARRPGDRG